MPAAEMERSFPSDHRESGHRVGKCAGIAVIPATVEKVQEAPFPDRGLLSITAQPSICAPMNLAVPAIFHIVEPENATSRQENQ
jgi:hypothetical protein